MKNPQRIPGGISILYFHDFFFFSSQNFLNFSYEFISELSEYPLDVYGTHLQKYLLSQAF